MRTLGIVLGTALASGGAAAGTETVHPVWALSFEDEVADSACPGEAELRALVARQIGRDPFLASGTAGTRSLSVRLFRAGSGLGGLVVWQDRGATAQRLIEERGGACRALVEAVAFAIVVRIQLLGADQAAPARNDEPPARRTRTPAREATPAAPSETPSPTPAPAPPPPVTSQRTQAPPAARLVETASTAEPTSSPLRLWLGAAAFGLAGSGPEPIVEGRASVRMRWARGSLESSVGASLPRTFAETDGTGFLSRRIAIDLAPCLHFGPVEGCVLGRLARLTARGQGVDAPKQADAAQASVGLRLGWDWHLGPRWVLAAQTEALASPNRARFFLDGRLVWESPLVQAAIGVAIARALR